MNKIIDAINSMISNKDKIANVIKNETEYFYLFDNKYKWSIAFREGEFYLYFYPFDVAIEQIAHLTDWEGYDFITYSTKELKTTEAVESFKELYQTVQTKVFNIDKILEEIINKYPDKN